MQNSYKIFTLVIISAFLFCCKNDKGLNISQSKSSESSVDTNGLVKFDDIKPTEIPKFVASAKSILKHRLDSDGGKTWAAIESGVWEYEAVFAGGAMSEPGAYDGHWVDFGRDNTYEYGVYKDVQGKGTYHYNSDSKLLLMVNDDNNIKPIEWKVQLAGDMMVFSGSSVYKDNGRTGKLNRVESRP